MEFLFKSFLKANGHIPLSVVETTSPDLAEPNIFYILKSDKVNGIKEILFPSGKALFLGDPVFHGENTQYLQNCFNKLDLKSVIKSVDGFYFLVILNNHDQKLIITSSLFGILPVYYAVFKGTLLVSSSLQLIAEQTESSGHTVDKQYYLEKALFNYPLFNRTPIKEISTLPSNSCLEYSHANFSIKKYLAIHDYFTCDPKPWRKALDELSNLFIDQAQAFLPDEKFVATLTGGFDGRTVIGLALNQKKKFDTYSYGCDSDLDVTIPAKIAPMLNIFYQPVIFDKTYAKEYFWLHANEFVIKSHGLGNFSRAHYHYALETRLKDSRYLVTGNFGSEIIRSMKIPGVMISSPLFAMFEISDRSAYRDKILTYPGLLYLKRDHVEGAISDLLEEIDLYLLSLPPGLTLNQKFYVYLFEEVFRKYFGPEIMVQRNHLRSRSPYLNFTFIEALLKTEIAGANSAFKETNPFKRYHGQVLYAHILKKTFPKLLDLPLDRGYKPRDFLTLCGPLNIAIGYLKKNYFVKRDKNLTSYSTMTYEANLDHLFDVGIDDALFNRTFFTAQLVGGWKNDQMNFINMISAAHFHNLLQMKY